MHKIINTNNVKISYSCLPNIGKRLAKLNTKKLSVAQVQVPNEGDCRCRQECPVDGECKDSNLIYSASVSSMENGQEKVGKYYGQTSTTFISRYRNHMHSFKNKKLEKATELSKYIWNLKENKIKFEIFWKIERKANPYQPGGIFCHLCTSEAIAIGFHQGNECLINSKDEILSRCRHRDKWKLCKF